MKHIINIEKGKPIDYVRLDDINKLIDNLMPKKIPKVVEGIFGAGLVAQKDILEKVKEKLKGEKQ
jgi:hypothetical protein